MQFDLHVVEPGRKMGEFGHVSPQRSNTNFSQGVGRMDVVTVAPAEGATAETSYAVPRKTSEAQFYYATRFHVAHNR
ncbi:MAG: hypothetical protein EXR01_01555 [Acetobacteraceae bacterium]|nr:hypothetical protein [Acetobacteraceae bacterium]